MALAPVYVAGAALCEPPCADFVAGTAPCEPACADFVAGAALCDLHVQISWQAQHFVNLHVQISWQAQYKMRFREIAEARNTVFSIERVAPKLASQALWNDVRKTVSGHGRVMVGSCSDHARIMLGIVPPLWLEFSLVS